MGSDDVVGKVKDPVVAAIRWVKTRSPSEKLALSCMLGCTMLLILWKTIKDHNTLFILSELAHFIGIGILAYKLQQKKSVAGLSLQSQILTFVFLLVRLICSFTMEYDVHTLLDFLTLLATGGVTFCMMVPREIKLTYQKEQDRIKWYYVAVPCLVIALFVHPKTNHWFMFRVMWAVCVYMEAVSVFPQLRMMQKAKVVERFTAHYVFMLGVARFFSCAHWIIQILDGNKHLLMTLGSGLWPATVLLSEVVQTFILANFCFYYVKSYADGSGIVRLPAGIV